MPPLTLRFSRVRRHITSHLCSITPEDLAKNVFLFRASQQPFFPLCLVSLCGCAFTSPYMLAPKTGTFPMHMRMLKGGCFPLPSSLLCTQRFCFITQNLDCGGVFTMKQSKGKKSPTFRSGELPLCRVTSGFARPQHTVGT